MESVGAVTAPSHKGIANGNGRTSFTGVYDPDDLLYPDSDGKPMAENTIQYRWIVTIQGNLERLFKDDPNVFVAGDLLWYAVEGEPTVRQAPDVLVAFGRPKGDRGSYRQWQEGGIAPQVVFEVLSPGNRVGEMARKFEFYERHGVAEYYIYDPKDGDLSVWVREAVDSGSGASRLRVVDWQKEWISPRLGVRFVPVMNAEMTIYYPDGRRFLTLAEMDEAREQAETAMHQAEAAARHAEVVARRAEAQARHAEVQRDSAVARAERLAALLRAAGIDPDLDSASE